MIRKYTSSEETEFFNLPLAKWVVGVLAMLIAVVGKESLVGLILRQTRTDIAGLLQDEERRPDSSTDAWYMNN